MIKTKQLVIALIMLFTAFQVDAKVKKNATTPQTKKERTLSRVRGLIQLQSPMFAQKKTRGSSRLIANSNYDLTSGSAVMTDSLKYNYLPTNGFGYDKTPNLFGFDDLNKQFYDDRKNNFDSSVTYWYDGSGNLIVAMNFTNLFNTTHQLTQNEVVGISFPLYQKSNIAYNMNDMMYETIDTFNSGGTFSGMTKTVFTFNANNKVNVIDVFEKDSTTQVWLQVEKDSLFYDVNNNIISANIYDVAGTTLDNSYRLTFTYNSANKLLTELFEMWNGTSWDDDGKYVNTYNASNQMLTGISLVWNGTTYDNDGKTTYTYGSATYPTSMTNSTWNGTSWDDDNKDVFTYNSSNQVLTDNYFTWDGTAWVPSSNSIYYYEIFAPQAILSVTLDATVSIYPNPVENLLNVNIQLNQDDNITLSVVDLNGKVVYQTSSIKGKNSTTPINTTSFAKGVYMIQIKGNNGETSSKFIK